VTKIVAPVGHQLSLSHDGKRLLFTRDEQGKDRTIVMYDAGSGKSTDVMRGLVQRAFWSPDDSRIAFMRSTGQDWTVWTMPAGSPDKALQLSTGGVWGLHGWLDAQTVLASDDTKLYFLKLESPPTAMAIREVYGDGYEVMSSDTIRANPANPDLLMVTAYVSHPKAGMPTDAKTGMGGAAFLYELKSKRRVDVTPANVFAQDAEWSRDAIQIFFTNREKAPVICRVFWDGSGYKRVRAGSDLVVGE
jgi:WD40-like Beta Propeller Repeat